MKASQPGSVTPPCLSEDTVLEFVQGKLPVRAQTAVDEHMFGCPDCRRVVADTANFFFSEAPSPQRKNAGHAGALAALCAVIVLGCVGTIDDARPGSGAAPEDRNGGGGVGVGMGMGEGGSDEREILNKRPASGGPGPAPVRRLTNEEYDNTVADLLGATGKTSAAFDPDTASSGFANEARYQVVSTGLAQDYIDAAEILAARYAAPASLPKVTSGLATCNPVRDEDTCVRAFIEAFGKRAFRRPLTPAEQTKYFETWSNVHAIEGTFSGGLSGVLNRMLLSPFFLYRIETGDGPAGKGMMKLSPWETASRLSYFLWGSMPDAVLFAEADAGRLGTAAEIETQARRLLASPRAARTVARFSEDWLNLRSIDVMTKDAKLFPTFKPEVRASLKEETLRAVADVWTGDGDMRRLFTSPQSYVNQPLAEFLKIPVTAAMGPARWAKITTNAGQRMGILSHAGIMAALSKGDQTLPPRRAKFILQDILCVSVPPPPADAPPPPPVDPNFTTRERFEKVAEAPGTVCATCHRLLDPVGFALENYDGAGLWRDQENGKPVDARGVLQEAGGLSGEVTDPITLLKKVAASPELASCAVKNWFHFMQGREVASQDARSLWDVREAFAQKNFDMKELLVALTQTDAFRFLPKEGAP